MSQTGFNRTLINQVGEVIGDGKILYLRTDQHTVDGRFMPLNEEDQDAQCLIIENLKDPSKPHVFIRTGDRYVPFEPFEPNALTH